METISNTFKALRRRLVSITELKLWSYLLHLCLDGPHFCPGYQTSCMGSGSDYRGLSLKIKKKNKMHKGQTGIEAPGMFLWLEESMMVSACFPTSRSQINFAYWSYQSSFWWQFIYGSLCCELLEWLYGKRRFRPSCKSRDWIFKDVLCFST